MKNYKEGFVFVQLIIAVAVLGFLLILFTQSVNQVRIRVSREIKAFEEMNQHRSKAYSAISLIAQDDPKIDHLRERWNQKDYAKNLSNQNVFVTIEDESGKFDLNRTVDSDEEIRKQYRFFINRLLEKLEVPMYETRQIYDFIKKNAPLVDLEQLRILDEIYEERGLDLRKYLTVHSRGRVNINTAPREILEVLLEDGQSILVKEILQNRERDPITKIESLRGVELNTLKFMTIKSSFFRIRTWKEKMNSKKCKLSIIVERELGEIKIRQWIEK